jgi:hypothetical protein
MPHQAKTRRCANAWFLALAASPRRQVADPDSVDDESEFFAVRITWAP